MADTREPGGCLGALLRLFLQQDAKGAVTYPFRLPLSAPLS
jgi:hypothetical protein